MGIKGLQRYITSTNAQSLQPYVKYRTKIFAIDVNILIYKFCHAYPHSIGSFLECFVYKITAFLKFGIFPVFVFDGQAPVEKQKAITRRITSKRVIRERLEKLKKITNRTPSISQHISRLERQCFMVTKVHRKALVRLIESLNLPIFVAEGEAETLCAVLQRNGHVDYTLSEDTDTLAYGCRNILRMFRGSDRYLVETDLDCFLSVNGLSHDEFLNVCVLSGCDYLDSASPTVRIEKCIDFVRKYRTLDQTVQEMCKTCPMHDLAAYERVKDIYKLRSTTGLKIIDQHTTEHVTIGKKLSEYERIGECGSVNFLNLHQLFRDYAIGKFATKCLIKTIQESVHQFSIIRHNFFSIGLVNTSSSSTTATSHK